jgi:hypothetical protein
MATVLIAISAVSKTAVVHIVHTIESLPSVSAASAVTTASFNVSAVFVLKCAGFRPPVATAVWLNEHTHAAASLSNIPVVIQTRTQMSWALLVNDAF